MNQRGIFINQNWSCCLVSIHHGLYYDIQMIQCEGVCVLSWPGQREREGARGERAREINACRERLFSAVRGPELSNQVFLCRINERAFHAIRAMEICRLPPQHWPNNRGDGDVRPGSEKG